ncbi:N-acetylglucosamine kinase [Anditalea andensis]|uniref:N-acetylglucosamine kinase n=1 Tax=Anditalea andensis TaxID=1048983 RepID=A0A074L6Q2_9BACT|nr:N-acetylglucosamine kinase [Anditalea andensis]KEO75513.1 N-acetylglucosamine kinase [Anditalea andensis]
MFLIADSGSSKTNWKYVNANGEILTSLKTVGLNPYFNTIPDMSQLILTEVAPYLKEVSSIHFYGAGCGHVLKANEVKQAIKEAIPAPSVQVESDMLGAARSIFLEEPGIASILGAGANSCVYDGYQIIQNVPSLGYLLADWGSGAVMGKDMLSLVLQEKVPKYILEDFYHTYQMDTREILDMVYNRPMANKFLSGFSPFLLKYAHQEESFRDMIIDNFRKFFDYYILTYGRYVNHLKVGLIGSIAFHFQEYLMAISKEKSIPVRTIIQDPMDGLVRYHYQFIQNTF